MSLYHHSFFFTIYSRSIPQILLKLPQILLLPEYLWGFYLSHIPELLHSCVCAICHSIFLCNIYHFLCNIYHFFVFSGLFYTFLLTLSGINDIINVNYSATELPEHLKSGGIPPFSGCVHDTNTACISAMQLLLLFLEFLVRLQTVPSVFRIRKDISAGY